MVGSKVTTARNTAVSCENGLLSQQTCLLLTWYERIHMAFCLFGSVYRFWIQIRPGSSSRNTGRACSYSRRAHPTVDTYTHNRR